jgi:glycopeptide antibiotics resistance protein
MSAYLEPIRMAAIFFPFIALMLSVPFVLIQYHKFGAVSFVKALVLYSFVLYALCAYFLVILPLPDRAAVAAQPAPPMQWIPFHFIADFIHETPLRLSNTATYLPSLTDGTVIQPIFNVFLTLPFGVYLRYYFGVSKKRVLLYTFLLSLFFELTQLSGLYGIYAHAYRFFDVDDLMLNTLGGLVGWLCAAPLIKILPSREKIEQTARVRGRKVSGLRRATGMVLDLVLCSALVGTITLLLRSQSLFWVPAALVFAYYIVVPALWNGSTLGGKFLNLRVVNHSNHTMLVALCARAGMFLLTYLVAPAGIGLVLAAGGLLFVAVAPFYYLACLAAVCTYYLCVGVKYLFTDQPMLYEQVSGTSMASTTAPELLQGVKQ